MYAQKAMVPTMTAVAMRRCGLGSSTFSCDKRPHVAGGASVQHMARLNPSAARGADAEPHLPPQRFHAMAVTVHDHCDTGVGRSPRQRAVHVEVTGGAVDLHRGAGLGRRGKQLII